MSLGKFPPIVVDDLELGARQSAADTEDTLEVLVTLLDRLGSLLLLQDEPIDAIDDDRLPVPRRDHGVGHLGHAVDDGQRLPSEAPRRESLGEHLVALVEARFGPVGADANRREIQTLHLPVLDTAGHQVEAQVWQQFVYQDRTQIRNQVWMQVENQVQNQIRNQVRNHIVNQIRGIN